MRDWGQFVIVRPLDARPSTREHALVVDSWILSWAPHAHPRLLPAQAAPIVEDHLARCDRVLVAEVPEVAGPICGWVARARPGVLAYLYVLHDYRRHGIAERLLRAVDIDPRARFRYSFATPRFRALCHFDPRRPTRIPWKGVPDHGHSRSARGYDRSRG